MDLSRLGTGEKIAGASGIALILIMFIFDWYGVSVGGNSVPGSGANAWQAFGFIDIILFVTSIAAIALAVVAANQTEIDMPVALSAIVAGLGILSLVLVLYRIIDTPGDTGAASALVGTSVDVSRKIGVFLGLIAAAGIAYGGWAAMQEEGTSFGGQVGGGPPPPPPPPAA